MDDATLDLILALKIQDLAELTGVAAGYNGQVAEGNTSRDAHIAREIYRAELRNNAAIISDHRFSEKVSEATSDEPLSPVPYLVLDQAP